MSEKTVLIIDDDKNIVDTMQDALRSMGFKVAVAYDGLVGVAQAHQLRPDLVFLDVNLPAGGGVSVYERLRDSADTSGIPVIFTTGVPVETLKSQIHPGPSTYFLKKPVSLSQIQAVVHQMLKEPAAPALTPDSSRMPQPGLKTHHHEFEVRVTYADTDKMGVIYYGNYFRYFELGRTELMRSLGVRYRDLEVDRKLFLPVVETRCDYMGPSRYDDLLLVRTWLAQLGPASVTFIYQIFNRDGENRLIARGQSRHAVVGEGWKPVKIPADLRSLLEPYVAR